ncbi:hypothetical protein P3G67_05775 [Streptomyces sp. RB6PN23]|uniref:Uncharacterized protein n=2 Tax=Streptomyces silvisoli TaxID=3034235 RepID=A0ABT5ZG02_9ACTN|nr:hypothetical protein [Streptomyces silvisoli]
MPNRAMSGEQRVATVPTALVSPLAPLSAHDGFTVIPGQDDALPLTVAACVEAMVPDD